MQPHPIQQFFGFGKGFVPIDHTVFGALITKEHIFGDGKKRNKCKFLMDNNQANFFRVMNILKSTFLAIKIYSPAVRTMWIDTAQHLHQGRFTSSVFTDESVNFSLPHTKAHIIKCFYAGENLCDVTHFQNDIRHGLPVLHLHGMKLLYYMCNSNSIFYKSSRKCVRIEISSRTKNKTTYFRSSALI